MVLLLMSFKVNIFLSEKLKFFSKGDAFEEFNASFFLLFLGGLSNEIRWVGCLYSCDILSALGQRNPLNLEDCLPCKFLCWYALNIFMLKVEAMLDKTICAMSSVFIGASGSTFTGDILRLRKDWGSASLCDEYLCQGEEPNVVAEMNENTCDFDV